jgi:glycosyltransferase involved in cell wall biosynthesis
VDTVFVENQWMNDQLCETLGTDRVILAPPGVDTVHFRPAESVSDLPGERVILCVGRLGDSRKRVDLLFEAYARLCARLEDPPRLLLAGFTAPSEANWIRARELGVFESIEFFPNVSTDELADLYRSASIFVLSSDEEGLGIVIVEAMASGLPVVSTDCGGPSTSIIDGETGLLVPRNDPEALAFAMHTLFVDSELRARMARRGRQRATDVFSLEATGRSFLDWYDCVLASEAQ